MRRAPAVTLLLLIAFAGLLAVLAIQRIEKPGSPIGVPTVSAAFSPNGDGIQDAARLTIHTKHRDTVDIWIIDAAGKRVTEVARNRKVAGLLTVYWNGAGANHHQGTYRMQVRSQRAHRTITVPSPISLDLSAPDVRDVRWDTSRFKAPLRTIRVDATLVKASDVHDTYVELQQADGSWTLVPTVRILRHPRPGGSSTIQLSAKLPASEFHAKRYTLRLTVLDAAGNPARNGTVVIGA